MLQYIKSKINNKLVFVLLLSIGIISSLIYWVFEGYSKKFVFKNLYYGEERLKIEEEYILSQSYLANIMQENLSDTSSPLLNLSVYQMGILDEYIYGQKIDAVLLFFESEKLVRVLYIFTPNTVNKQEKAFNNIYENINEDDYRMLFQGNWEELKKIVEEKSRDKNNDSIEMDIVKEIFKKKTFKNLDNDTPKRVVLWNKNNEGIILLDFGKAILFIKMIL